MTKEKASQEVDSNNRQKVARLLPAQLRRSQRPMRYTKPVAEGVPQTDYDTVLRKSSESPLPSTPF
jgi:hypothetical protein